MKQNFLLRILLIFVCLRAVGIDIQQTNSETVCFNIGGYKTKFARQTIVNFGGPILNQLIGGKFKEKSQPSEEIFIDWPKEGGKLLAYYIRTQKLPNNYDDGIARDTGEYFQIEAMLKYVDDHKKNKSDFKSFFSFQGRRCPECKEYIKDDLFYTIKHLVEEHEATIDGSYACEDLSDWEWGILYRI